jgi:hypothetical protein
MRRMPLTDDTVYCHCGRVLHYPTAEAEQQMRRTVARYGPSLYVSDGAVVYIVQRHYVALHGFTGASLPGLGFPTVTTDAAQATVSAQTQRRSASR